jgi:protein subunit release factor A
MDDKEFRIRVTKGHGPGGQHKNKVESCAIVTHIATGMQEICQDSRSKLKNIETAKNRLIARIEKRKEDLKHEERNELRKKLISNPKIIRTYSFVRKEVVDHRTKEHYDLDKFLDGKIDFPQIKEGFI